MINRQIFVRVAPDRQGKLIQSGDALIGAAVNMVSRLRDHIERLDSGVAYAADDIAVLLRALVCDGNGNFVLQRLYSACGLERAMVTLSAPPRQGMDVRFSVGSIPTWERCAFHHSATIVPFTKWRKAPLLTIRSPLDSRTYTWGQFIAEYSHKWGGAHLDKVVPGPLQIVDRYAVGDFSLSGYLLRTAAVQTWILAQKAFEHHFREGASTGGGPAWPRATYYATGGIGSVPRDTREKGHLQWFYLTDNEANYLWYVDDTSPNNVMRLVIGGTPYDVRFTPTGLEGPTVKSIDFIEPRAPKSTSIRSGSRPNATPIKVNGTHINFTKEDDYYS